MKKVALIVYAILMQSIIIAINAANLLHTADANNNKSKHIKQYYKRRSYQWNANIHQTTGIASSFEQSIFHKHQQPPSNCNAENNDGLSMHRKLLSTTTKKKQMKHIIQNIVSSYPKFLSKPSLTFGLCQSVPSHIDGCNHHLQTSLLHLNVLTFGKPRIVKPSIKHIFIDHKPSSTEEEMVVCCIEIPIEGGLLANVESKTSTLNTKSKKKEEDHGCLRFTWLQTKQPNELQHTKKHIKYQHPDIILVTEIRGKYRPTLAGNKLPISNMRKMLYYSTQRMLHTYVMWRYHDYVVKECSRRIDG